MDRRLALGALLAIPVLYGLLLGLGSVVGLLTTSIVLDALWPPLAGPSLPVAVAAVLVALTGVVAAVVPWSRLRRRAQRAGD